MKFWKKGKWYRILAAVLTLLLTVALVTGCGAGSESASPAPSVLQTESGVEEGAGNRAEGGLESQGEAEAEPEDRTEEDQEERSEAGQEEEAFAEDGEESEPAEDGAAEAEPGDQSEAETEFAEAGEELAAAGEEQAEPEQAEPEPSVTEDGSYNTKDEVALYIHTFGHLPDNYITKKEAEDLGWDSRKGNLDEVAPGKSIGGSHFGNYEKQLPEKKGRKYYECDIDFEGGYRGAERIIYSNDGLVFYTGDHYKTFEQLY